jgi:DNA-binding MarR family transcriptional regulator
MDRPNLNPPLHDPIASRLGYLLRRASSVMMADLGDGLAAIGLRPVEATILILVGANPGCIQSDLGRMLGIKRANMAPLISTLATKGYLDKSPVDGRSLALTLTKAGEAIRSRADGIMNEHERRFDDILNGHDQGPLRAMLLAIAAGGEEQGG